MGNYDGAAAWGFDDDELESLPTQIAYTLSEDDAQTTLIDLGAFEDVEGLTRENHDVVTVDEHPGWGPVGSEELLRTMIFERDERLADASQTTPQTYDTDEFFETQSPYAPPVVRRSTTATHNVMRAGSSWNLKGGRGVIVAGLCVGAGILFGTGIGLAANRGEADPQPLPSADVASTQVEPTAVRSHAAAQSKAAPLAEPIAEPVPSLPEPESIALEPSIALVQSPVLLIDTPPETDPLDEADEALQSGDLELASQALEHARSAGADATILGRLDTALAVQRGDGAIALTRLRQSAERRGGAEDWIAVAQLLVQAEHDSQAARAFQEAIAAEPSNARAHLGLARLHARAAEIGTARRHLRQAREAIEGEPIADDALEALFLVAEATIALERGDTRAALRDAEEARHLDDRSSEASLLLARIAQMRSQSPVRHLRDAIAGRAPAPMAYGLLAPRVEGEEACDLAGHYLDRAPEGFDARAMQRVLRACDAG